MIRCENVTVSYAMQPNVLKNCNLEIQGPTVTGIIGPNGAGKSTLLKAMLGLVTHSGKITFDEELSTNALARIAYVEQKSNIDFTFPITIRECVALGRSVRLKPFQRLKENDWIKIDEAIEKVGLRELAKRPIGALSGGQFQRVLLARCLVQEAKYIFLDEPFVGIDTLSETVIMSLIRQWKQEGKTILMVHHDLSKVRDYFDQVVLVNHEIIASGETNTVFIPEYLRKTYGGEVYIAKEDDLHE